MRLLLFADLHLDTPFRWAPPAVARRRRQALRDTLTDIVELARQESVDALCGAGDLHEHDMVAPDTAAFLRDRFALLGDTPVLLAPGNHDWWGPTSLYASTDWSPNVHVFTGQKLEPFDLAPDFTMWGAAHHAPSGTPNPFRGVRIDRPGTNVALVHASLESGLAFQEEGKQPHAPFDEADIATAGLDHALLGHYHRPRDTDLLTYPGNPEPLRFGEDGTRAAVILDFTDGRLVERRRIVVGRTTVSDLDVDVDGAASVDQVRDIVRTALASADGILRVTLRGDIEPDVALTGDDLTDLGVHLDAVVWRLDRLGIAFDLDAIADEPTVRGRFVRDVRAADLDADQRMRILTAGLRALAGRHDLERTG